MQLERKEMATGSVGQAEVEVVDRAWKGLWKLKMIPRVKEFAWRVYRDIGESP